jgi:hypothetical protein
VKGAFRELKDWRLRRGENFSDKDRPLRLSENFSDKDRPLRLGDKNRDHKVGY